MGGMTGRGRGRGRAAAAAAAVEEAEGEGEEPNTVVKLNVMIVGLAAGRVLQTQPLQLVCEPERSCICMVIEPIIERSADLAEVSKNGDGPRLHLPQPCPHRHPSLLLLRRHHVFMARDLSDMHKLGSAGSVVDGVRLHHRSGHAVVCTLHEPLHTLPHFFHQMLLHFLGSLLHLRFHRVK
jgi:hypothetical protein